MSAGTSSSSSAHQKYLSSSQFLASGQLKNNVQSRLDYLSDVFLSLSELVQTSDAQNRQMKEFIAVLLHFKYMLQFLRANLLRDEELFRKLGPDAAILFKTDLKQCLAKFNALVASSAGIPELDFVTQRSDYYRVSAGAAYCSYSEDDVVAPIVPPPPVKRGRFGGGSGEVYSGYRSTNHYHSNTVTNTSLSNASAESASSEREMEASNASDSEHLEIKLEPDLEIIEQPSMKADLSDDSSRPTAEGGGGRSGNNNSNSMLTAMLDKPIISSSSSLSHHRLTRDRNNDLKMTLRKVVKRSMAQSYQDEDGTTTPPITTSSTSNNEKSSSNNINNINSKAAENISNNSQLYQRKHRAAKTVQNYAVFEREHSREEEQDYDFDYEREDYDAEEPCFDEEDLPYQQHVGGATASYNAAGQIRCPQSGCGLCFDVEDDLSEHMKLAHFTNVDFNTFVCLVEGCTEKFPNSARATVHMKNVHPEEYITCDQCQKQVKAHYMRKHFYMRHRKGMYKCSQDCDYVAEYYHELEKHRYMVHNNRYSWADYSGGGGGGSAPVASSSNIFFPSNPIAAAIMASHNNSGSNSSSNGHHSFGNHPSEDQQSAANLRQPTTSRRYLCKYPDANCSYWHENRSRTLQHIRTQHLNSSNGSMSSNSGRPTSSSSSSSSSNKNGVGGGGSLVLEDRAAEYLEVYDFPENSFYD